MYIWKQEKVQAAACTFLPLAADRRQAAKLVRVAARRHLSNAYMEAAVKYMMREFGIAEVLEALDALSSPEQERRWRDELEEILFED